MDKKIILGTFAFGAILIAALLLIPSTPNDTPDTLPWKISHPTPDTSRVFGITLGQTSLDQAEHIFKEKTEVSLFKTNEGKMLVEAFFDELNLNGLKAKFVFNIAIPAEELNGMYSRGLRINNTPSGKRITLAADDLAHVRQLAVSGITYLPTSKLEEAVFSKRFGIPAERIREKKSNAVHWLYPQHGLDITLGGDEKPLLQYIALKDFELLRKPLLDQGEILKN
jgi:hypothetical protein